MALDVSTVKRLLQDHLQEGLVLVIGSGLSIAEGIPGMGELAGHLKSVLPTRLAVAADLACWNSVVSALDAGDHLEAAMGKVPLTEATVDAIVDCTARLIREREAVVINEVIAGTRTLPFSTFARHLFKGARKYHLITPNYDRLLELATEMAGIGVDARFFGAVVGRSEPKRSADAHRESYLNGRNSAFRPTPHFCIYKPHGSLDWFETGGGVVRCQFPVDMTPLIITPGVSKYRESFHVAFDDQRTAGNRAIDNGSRLMFIGYGFNDDHLEQHICPNFKLTRPAVILCKTLTENAKKVLKNSPNVQVIAISADSASDLRSQINTSTGERLVVDEPLWALNGFNKGVIS